MATAEMRFQPERSGGKRGGKRRPGATSRLLQAERSDEVFPLLLEEIVALGYARALVLQVNFETGEVVPAASLKWPQQQMKKFTTPLWMQDHPLAAVLERARPAVLTGNVIHGHPVYLHPILFSSRNLCWEADRARTTGCLAVQNLRREKRIRREEQVCSTCEINGYAAVVLVELKRSNCETALSALDELIEVANCFLSRLFKVEHYNVRMREMEIAIARMGTVMQSMADPVVLTDREHQMIMLNAAAERFFKVPDEMSAGLVRAVELNNRLFSAVVSSMRDSSGAYREMTLVDAMEGEEKLFEAVSAPSFGPDGVRRGTVTVLRDVTDLRRADQELRDNYDRLREVEGTVRQERDRLNLIVENVGDPIVVCDRERRPVLVDPLAEELFGPLQKKSPRLPAQSRNCGILDACIRSFTGAPEDRANAPLRLYNPKLKQDIEYDARLGKIFGEHGEVVYTVTVLRDLTALRRVEQLKVERRMLEIEKFAAAGRLAATIAHEVNNPLDAIKNSVYLLAGVVPESAQPVYSILRSETERVARIVRQMLGLYRNTEQVKPANLNTIIEDTLLLLNRQLQRANIEVICELRPVPDAVIAADKIRQVLSNLVINARDAMPNGGKLRIRSRHVFSGPGDLQGWVRVLVGDSGTGIPAEMIRAIFEPFVTTKGEKGTGLGLWIVKGILQNHAGRLSVRSKMGSGTVFKIDLPVVKP